MAWVLPFARRSALFLPAVEHSRVPAQDFRPGRFGDVLAAPNGGDDVREHPVPMRIIRGEQDLVVADEVEHVGKHLLFGFGGEEPAPVLHVVAWLLSAER